MARITTSIIGPREPTSHEPITAEAIMASTARGWRRRYGNADAGGDDEHVAQDVPGRVLAARAVQCRRRSRDGRQPRARRRPRRRPSSTGGADSRWASGRGSSGSSWSTTATVPTPDRVRIHPRVDGHVHRKMYAATASDARPLHRRHDGETSPRGTTATPEQPIMWHGGPGPSGRARAPRERRGEAMIEAHRL